MLKFDPQSAKAADVINTAIKESGKYIGTITRAEKLTSKSGNSGIGLSFHTDAGDSADYLDLYVGATDGKPWPSTNTVNAILCCLRLRKADEGTIQCEKYNLDTRQREKVNVPGYPTIQGKRIGLLLRRELSTYNGKDQEKLSIVGVFEAQTELTASEILAGVQQPEKLPKMLQSLLARPVIDKREKQPSRSVSAGHATTAADPFDGFDNDIPF